MGFGHRVYKSYDPRAKIIKKTADAVFQVTGRNPLLDIALELERIALEDDYFIKRKLYPNVDFLLWPYLPVHGAPPGHVPSAFCHTTDLRLDCPVGRDAAGFRTETRPAKADLSGRGGTRLCAYEPTRLRLLAPFFSAGFKVLRLT